MGSHAHSMNHSISRFILSHESHELTFSKLDRNVYKIADPKLVKSFPLKAETENQ